MRVRAAVSDRAPASSLGLARPRSAQPPDGDGAIQSAPAPGAQGEVVWVPSAWPPLIRLQNDQRSPMRTPNRARARCQATPRLASAACSPPTLTADRSSVQSHRQRRVLGEQHGRPCLEALPPRPHRGVRHIELLGDRPQPQPTRQLAGQTRADHRHRIQAPDEHQVWQQRVRSPTRRTPTPPNPDPFDQQRCAQPAPIATPADEPPQTAGQRWGGTATCWPAVT